MDEQEKEGFFHKRARIAEQWSEAKSSLAYLTEYRKSKKAILMKDAERDNPRLSGQLQEREAYAHPEYLELLDGLREATRQEALYRQQLITLDQMNEKARSLEATSRAEMNMR